MKRRHVIKTLGITGLTAATSPLLSWNKSVHQTKNNSAMWNKTKLTSLLGIPYPIVQGPFGGGLSSAALTSTVSNAGGLGG